MMFCASMMRTCLEECTCRIGIMVLNAFGIRIGLRSRVGRYVRVSIVLSRLETLMMLTEVASS